MSSFGENREEVGEAMRELIKILERVSGKKLSDLIKAMPLIPDDDVRERLMAGMLLVTLGEKDDEGSEKVTMSSSILISLLSEIYRWREMFGSINLLEGEKK